jgi:hypothetical protein|tara:strand:+ start:235 stop:561 length:327 start_codon:yes stop_codon:yes gene_type:complete
MSKFVSTINKGFNMTFENGFSISVQWGVGNYCDRKNDGSFDESMKGDFWESTSAEIMVTGKGDGVVLGNGDNVAGWLSTDKVAEVINICSTARNTSHLNQMLKSIKLN